MKSSLFILKEHFNNLYLMKRLAQFEMKISNKIIIWEQHGS